MPRRAGWSARVGDVAGAGLGSDGHGGPLHLGQPGRSATVLNAVHHRAGTEPMDATLEQSDPRPHGGREGAHRPSPRGRGGAADPHRPLHRPGRSSSWNVSASSGGPGSSPATSPSGPSPASYRLFTRSGAPIVVVRGEDGVLRAFYNACRHRGAPVTREECGTARRLTCQYHSWSYGTDGTLRVGARRPQLRRPRHRTSSGWCRCAARAGRAGCSSARTPTPRRSPSSSGRCATRCPTSTGRRCARSAPRCTTSSATGS